MDYLHKNPNMTPEEAIQNITLYIVELVTDAAKKRDFDALMTESVAKSIVSDIIQSLIEFERLRISKYLRNVKKKVFTTENKSRLGLDDNICETIASSLDYCADDIIHGEYIDRLSEMGIDPTDWYTKLTSNGIKAQL